MSVIEKIKTELKKDKQTKIIIPKADVTTGNCFPVLSCLFFAHLLKIKLDIRAKIKAIKT